MVVKADYREGGKMRTIKRRSVDAIFSGGAVITIYD
jgi:hypothetical protein